MKLLELTIYPQVDRMVGRFDKRGKLCGGWREYGYVTSSGTVHPRTAGYLADDKHFIDAELTAEYWCAVANGEWLPIAYTFNRFALHPHALEARDVRE